MVLALYDASGRRVRTLVDADEASGPRTATIDAAELPAGVYLARLVQHGGSASRKILISR